MRAALKKISAWLHLWLGLISGLVVVIVSLTGCCYVFINEIEAVTKPWKTVAVQPLPYLPPSQLEKIAGSCLNNQTINYLGYTPGKAVYVLAYGKDSTLGAYLDPYTGKVLHRINFDTDFDFFRCMLRGHRSLWLPDKTGSIIVDGATLIFVVLLFTGLALWWPRRWNKHYRDRGFKIKWKARFKRLNYDLHNVLGFYTLLVALAIACTGLVWGYQWFAQSLFWVTSGGQRMEAFQQPPSDTTSAQPFRPTAADSLWQRIVGDVKHVSSSVAFPSGKTGVVTIMVNHRPGTFYKQDVYVFDQYTLKPLTREGVYKGKYADASFANIVSRMNYDVHVGAIWGLPGKILAFFASLICATLPVTGFCIWWGKKKKKRRRKTVKKKRRQEPAVF